MRDRSKFCRNRTAQRLRDHADTFAVYTDTDEVVRDLLEAATEIDKRRPLVLRDEALDLLASKVQDDIFARVEIAVDHGEFEARYIYTPQGEFDKGIFCIRGDRLRNLTNALVSLAEKLS